MASQSMCTRLIRCFSSISKQTVFKVHPHRNWRALSMATSADGASESETPKNEPSELEKKLTEEKEELQKVIEEVQDKYKRSLAETENVRQRMKKQIEDSKIFGIQSFCKDMLEVADILNKATGTVPKELLTNENPHLKSLYDGLVMTESQLQKVFNRHGLFQIVPDIGEKFDPNIHEALFMAPLLEGKDPGSIAQVTTIGYKLHERTVRPAVVGVFKDS